MEGSNATLSLTGATSSLAREGRSSLRVTPRPTGYALSIAVKILHSSLGTKQPVPFGLPTAPNRLRQQPHGSQLYRRHDKREPKVSTWPEH